MKNLRPLDGRVDALPYVISSQGDVSESDAQGIEGGNTLVNGFEKIAQIARLVLNGLDRIADVVEGDATALRAFGNRIKNSVHIAYSVPNSATPASIIKLRIDEPENFRKAPGGLGIVASESVGSPRVLVKPIEPPGRGISVIIATGGGIIVAPGIGAGIALVDGSENRQEVARDIADRAAAVGVPKLGIHAPQNLGNALGGAGGLPGERMGGERILV